MPVELRFEESGSVFARVGASQEVVSVKLDSKTSLSNTLNGSLASNAMERLPDRLGDAVSYWVQLHRKKQEP